jgi:hypothetical protein
MRWKGVIDVDLADGDPMLKPAAVLGESLAQCGQLPLIEVEDIDSPCTADLHVAQAEIASHLALQAEVVGDLIDES